MTSRSGRFPVREPRPAWVRLHDPIRSARREPWREAVGLLADGLGLATSLGVGAAAVLAGVTTRPGAGAATWPLVAVAVTTAISVGAAFVHRLRSRARTHRSLRFRDAAQLRRFALGLVVETALKGKGVVSLSRTVAYLERLSSGRRVGRRAVEAALRELAREFDAPITECDGEIFFGFRGVKRQFLAAEVVRRRLRLGRVPSGRVVFDTADTPDVAGRRDLEAFDERMRTAGPTVH